MAGIQGSIWCYTGAPEEICYLGLAPALSSGTALCIIWVDQKILAVTADVTDRVRDNYSYNYRHSWQIQFQDHGFVTI